jgi:hypothetical protein
VERFSALGDEGGSGPRTERRNPVRGW